MIGSKYPLSYFSFPYYRFVFFLFTGFYNRFTAFSSKVFTNNSYGSPTPFFPNSVPFPEKLAPSAFFGAGLSLNSEGKKRCAGADRLSALVVIDFQKNVGLKATVHFAWGHNLKKMKTNPLKNVFLFLIGFQILQN